MIDSNLEPSDHANTLFLPTPEQISEACLTIQRGWSVAERAKRWQLPRREHWLPPTINGNAAGVADISDDQA